MIGRVLKPADVSPPLALTRITRRERRVTLTIKIVCPLFAIFSTTGMLLQSELNA